MRQRARRPRRLPRQPGRIYVVFSCSPSSSCSVAGLRRRKALSGTAAAGGAGPDRRRRRPLVVARGGRLATLEPAAPDSPVLAATFVRYVGTRTRTRLPHTAPRRLPSPPTTA